MFGALHGAQYGFEMFQQKLEERDLCELAMSERKQPIHRSVDSVDPPAHRNIVLGGLKRGKMPVVKDGAFQNVVR